MTLLGSEVLLNVGFYMLIPLISVHYTQNVGLTAGTVGFVLGTRPLIQQVPSLIGGALADRIGYRAAITIGLFVRGLGYVIIAFADDLPRLLAGTIVFGLGGALIWANGRAAMAAISPRDTLASRYAIANTLENVLSALAPLLGLFLLRFDFTYVSLTAAASSFVGCLLIWLFLPAVPVAGSAAPPI
ncbi:MAG TPA: MFS transporter, partial [Dehalococcoidia bacterium]|nr:MFS transporter [Dehalococcoidia bacterium]